MLRSILFVAILTMLAGCTQVEPAEAPASSQVVQTGETPPSKPVTVKVGDVCGGDFIGVVCEGEGDTTYCKVDVISGDTTGVCTLKGTGICPRVYDPVCGVDGTTYDNDCKAEAAGVNIARKGACEPDAASIILPTEPGFEGEVCGGKNKPRECENPDEVCVVATGMCGASDEAGTCVKKPTVCTMDLRPVCGCDGMTFANACRALQAGVNIDHEGPCENAAE